MIKIIVQVGGGNGEGGCVQKIKAKKEGNIFILVDDKIFYLDFSVGKMWQTSRDNPTGLGEDHLKLIKES